MSNVGNAIYWRFYDWYSYPPRKVYFLVVLLFSSPFFISFCQDEPETDCPENQFLYNDTWPGWYGKAAEQYEALSDPVYGYIQSLPPGSTLRVRLEARAAEIYTFFINHNTVTNPDFAFPQGLGTCIEDLGTHNGFTEYYDQNPAEIEEHFLIITHSTFDYPDFLVIWNEINVLTSSITFDNEHCFLITNGNKEGGDNNEDLTQSLHWPKFEGPWGSRGPRYIHDNGSGVHTIDYEAGAVTVVGGRFGACVKETLYSLVLIDDPSNPNKDNHGDLTINLPMYAIATEDWKTLEDEYILANDTWSFLDFFEDHLPPNTGGSTTPILQGGDSRFHITTIINQREVESKGGEPGTDVREISFNLITREGNPPALPDLQIATYFVKSDTVYFSIVNNETPGSIRIRYPEEVSYRLVDSVTNAVYETGVFERFDGLPGSIASAMWVNDLHMVWPENLKLELFYENIQFESLEENNDQTIATGW